MGRGKAWSAYELQRLEEAASWNYEHGLTEQREHVSRLPQLAVELGRSYSAVKSMASRRGFKSFRKARVKQSPKRRKAAGILRPQQERAHE